MTGGPPTAVPGRGLVTPAPRAEPAASRPAAEGTDEPTVMALAVERVQAAGATHVHQVWLPPLETRIPLGRLLPLLAPHSDRGVQALGRHRLSSIPAPLAVS